MISAASAKNSNEELKGSVSAANRRDAMRFAHCSQVLYRGDTSTFQRGTTCDFSPQGARLHVKHPLPSGSPVALHVCVREPHSENSRMLSLQATVVWSKGAEIGVAFNGGCPADVRSLQIWVTSQLLTRRLA